MATDGVRCQQARWQRCRVATYSRNAFAAAPTGNATAGVDVNVQSSNS
jgi:hypothetical protein